MRALLESSLLLLALGACAPGPAATDAGQDAGLDVHVPDGQCEPPAGAGQRCESLSAFHLCLATEAAQRGSQCDLITVRPEAVAGFVCDEGIEWRDTFYGSTPTDTCSYDSAGELVGAMAQTSTEVLVAGYWRFSRNCVETPLCPERDAGSCVPTVNAYQRCDEDFSNLTFCAASEADQLARFCVDAGSYARVSSACDGGTWYRDVQSGVGPVFDCLYADGGLIGGAYLTDTNTGYMAGTWALPGCVQTSACP